MSDKQSSPAALDVLLRRSQSGVPPVALFWISLMLLFWSFWFVDAQPMPFWLFCVQFVLAGALPFCYAWDSRLLDGMRRNRFLESALLTCLSAEEWSDGLVVRALRSLTPTALKMYGGMLVLTGVLAPHCLLQTALWLPTVYCLTVVMSYFHQLRSVMDVSRPGRELRQVLVSAPLAMLAFELLTRWASYSIPQEAGVLLIGAAALAIVRGVIRGRLEKLVQGGSQRPVTHARAMRPWSRNLIVMRESWRSARRGGLLAVVGRRYVPFLIFTTVVAKMVFDVGVGKGPWFIYYDQASSDILGVFGLYIVVAVVLVYWSTLAAVYDERQQKTAILLQTTPITAREYLDGWIDFATRYRNLEILSIYTVGLLGIVGCWWTETGWNLARWAPHMSALQPDRIGQAVSFGAVTILLVRCVACLALWASAGTGSWVSMQLNLACWMVPYFIVVALVGSLGSALGGLFGGLGGTFGGLGATMVLTWWFYRFARAQAMKTLTSGDGEGLDCL